jgi:hypothetical protein
LWVQSRVAHALGLLDDRAAIEPLRQRADHVDPWLAAHACWALGRMGDLSWMPELRKRIPHVAQGDHRGVVAALAHHGDAYARRLVRAGLHHPATPARQRWLGSLVWTRPDLVDQALLTRDSDGDPPYSDPATAIDDRRVAMMARRLHRAEQEIRQRYQALAEDIPLRLAWTPDP